MLACDGTEEMTLSDMIELCEASERDVGRANQHFKVSRDGSNCI